MTYIQENRYVNICFSKCMWIPVSMNHLLDRVSNQTEIPLGWDLHATRQQGYQFSWQDWSQCPGPASSCRQIPAATPCHGEAANHSLPGVQACVYFIYNLFEYKWMFAGSKTTQITSGRIIIVLVTAAKLFHGHVVLAEK